MASRRLRPRPGCRGGSGPGRSGRAEHRDRAGLVPAACSCCHVPGPSHRGQRVCLQSPAPWHSRPRRHLDAAAATQAEETNSPTPTATIEAAQLQAAVANHIRPGHGDAPPSPQPRPWGSLQAAAASTTPVPAGPDDGWSTPIGSVTSDGTGCVCIGCTSWRPAVNRAGQTEWIPGELNDVACELQAYDHEMILVISIFPHDPLLAGSPAEAVAGQRGELLLQREEKLSGSGSFDESRADTPTPRRIRWS